MARHILKCAECGSYTMEEGCKCGGKALSPKPAKYSPEDKYASYRRKVKKKELISEGLY
jgi:H/ACA ribonucleoprotein complex subunit 3